MSPLSQTKRLAGARTRPLCDPSRNYMLSNSPRPSNNSHTRKPSPYIRHPRLDVTATVRHRNRSAEYIVFRQY